MFVNSLKVTLDNLKGIKHMEFNAPTHSGVYILTGVNGCGKSTLLTALARISKSNVFKEEFIETQFDNYGNAKISYEINKDNRLTSGYFSKVKNWNPHPKGFSLKNNTPFATVYYITTSQQRFFESELIKHPIRPTESRERAASVFIKEGFKEIFQTEKFDKLRFQTIHNIGAGARNPRRGNKVYYINEEGKIYSELNFSLGEKMVLNALDALDGIKEHSLLLIDEIELALHPMAQVRFYKLLQRMAKEKNMMVVISTHSPTLIKISENNYFLDKDEEGVVIVKENCYPSYILKDVTMENEVNPDYLLFVEDDQAKRLLSVIIESIRSKENCNRNFTYKITRVGGWEETIRLMSDFKSINPYSKKNVQAFPDQDAKISIDEISNKDENRRSDSGKRKLNLWNSHHQNILPLHITPELGVLDWLKIQGKYAKIQDILENQYSNVSFRFENILHAVLATPEKGGNDREKAKYRLMDIIQELRQRLPEMNEEEGYKLLYQAYVNDNYAEIKSYYLRQFCYILNRK